jgi:regulator of protease activity HflC (stomatin/prohibitin superfamily)
MMAVLNFIRDYERVARFRFGRFEGMMGPGVVIALPVVHKFLKVDTRVEVLEIPRQTNITKDNAPIDVDFLVYMRVDIDHAEKAVLEVADYHIAVVGLATTTLRAVIGDIPLDDVLSQRERINELIRVRLDKETGRWGIKVTNVEIRELTPPKDIQDSMNRQMTAERVRRATILEADGKKQANVTVAEGEKQAAILKAEGEKQSAILKAEGDQQAAVLRANGFSQALSQITQVARSVDGNTMSLQYLDTLKALGASPASKFIFPLEFTKLLGSFGLGGGNDRDDGKATSR